jgi:hypothetical protein
VEVWANAGAAKPKATAEAARRWRVAVFIEKASVGGNAVMDAEFAAAFGLCPAAGDSLRFWRDELLCTPFDRIGVATFKA